MSTLLVASFGWMHVGAHLARGAESIGVPLEKLEASSAHRGAWWWRQWCWRVADRRPPRLVAFQREALATFRRIKPTLVLTTGQAPLTARTLGMMKAAGARLVNYSTDDPWNPAHRAHWFLDTLPRYDLVCSTRRANVDEFRTASVRHVEWLPFAYAPDLHFPANVAEDTTSEDVFFYGNVDRDRVPLLESLLQGGFRLALYTATKVPASLRASLKGYADAATLRNEAARCPITLVIGRKANRDGHAMRSYEVPAMRGCPLVEDTAEHRAMFGPEGEAAWYFNSPAAMTARIQQLRNMSPADRAALRERSLRRITTEPNTYADRLRIMLELAQQHS